MTKTIPVISGREFHLKFSDLCYDNFDCDVSVASDSVRIKPNELIHVAEVVSSVQLDDLKKLIEVIDGFNNITGMKASYNPPAKPEDTWFYNIDKANETLTTFREKYVNLLKFTERWR